MSVIKEYFYNVKCDCCGKHLGNEALWRADEQGAKDDAYSDEVGGFINLGGKDYCPSCYEIDENDYCTIPGIQSWFTSPRGAFAALIDKVSGIGTWGNNPWVFVYEFELVK